MSQLASGMMKRMKTESTHDDRASPRKLLVDDSILSNEQQTEHIADNLSKKGRKLMPYKNYAGGQGSSQYFKFIFS